MNQLPYNLAHAVERYLAACTQNQGQHATEQLKREVMLLVHDYRDPATVTDGQLALAILLRGFRSS